MLRLRTILHPTDFSVSARAALVHALFLARRHGAALHLLHVPRHLGDDPLRGAFEAGVDESTFYQTQRQEADQRLQHLVEEVDARGVSIQRVVTPGRAPGETIVTYAEEEDVDLIVMGTHGRRGIRHMLIGSVAEEVVHRAPCPVMTAHASDKSPVSTTPGVHRLLVPVDFSTHSVSAVRVARELAALYQAQIDLLHVIEPVHYPTFYNIDVAEAYTNRVEDLKTQAQASLKELYAQASGPSVETAFTIQIGYPPQDILAVARELPADLIVMATHGLQAQRQLLLGSVTERVIRGAPCPVFVSKPFGKSLLDLGVHQAQPAAQDGRG